VQALWHIRKQCRDLHIKALPNLRNRAKTLGAAPGDVDVTLRWIRERAPIIIHVNLRTNGWLLSNDTHYRNQFETLTSNGTRDLKKRIHWEDQLFLSAYKKVPAFDRCKYGVLNVINDPQGVRCCKQYGTSYFLLRGTRLRTTFSAMDSAGIRSVDLATVDYYAHVLNMFSDYELKKALQVGTLKIPGSDSAVLHSYKEAQIHGEVRLNEHIELIMAHPRLEKLERGSHMLKALAERCHADVVWIEGGIDLRPGSSVGNQSLGGISALSSLQDPTDPPPAHPPDGNPPAAADVAGVRQAIASVPLPLTAGLENWEVECDNGWQPIAGKVLLAVRSARAEHTRFANFEMHGFKYRIDLEHGIQSNLNTGRCRQVRMRTEEESS